MLCVLQRDEDDEHDGGHEQAGVDKMDVEGEAPPAAAAVTSGGGGSGAGGGGDLVRKEMYLVKWKNLSYLHNSWEMVTHLMVCFSVSSELENIGSDLRFADSSASLVIRASPAIFGWYLVSVPLDCWRE